MKKMNKTLSLLLVVAMLMSISVSAFATTDYNNGTNVIYDATADNDGDGQPDAAESYTLTVPALMTPGDSGVVTLEGTWASNRVITVTASKTVEMKSDLNENDTQSLKVTFTGIEQVGSNTRTISTSTSIDIEEMKNALFGKWSGTFYYNLEIADYNAAYLQGKYEFSYYGSLSDALNAANTNTVGENQSNAADATVGIYNIDGAYYIILLTDVSEDALTIGSSVSLDLNGYTLSVSEPITVNATNVVLNGAVAGSTLQSIQTEKGKAANLIKVNAGASLTLNSGNYISNSQNAATDAIYSDGDLVINSAVIKADETDGSTNGVKIGESGSLNMSVTTIDAMAVNGQSYGLWNHGEATLENTTIRAFANYGAVGEQYTAQSRGVRNLGAINLYDCYVVGTHSGVTSFGNTYVDGGVYESYGHGGFYLAGPDATHYIYNATLMSRDMPDGYVDGGADTNDSAMYVGGAAGMDNIVVYIDNCDFYAEKQVIVLRGSSNEKNNTIYISNSRVNRDFTQGAVRIDNATHKLYIGVGNNFGPEDGYTSYTNFELADVIFETTDSYKDAHLNG